MAWRGRGGRSMAPTSEHRSYDDYDDAYAPPKPGGRGGRSRQQGYGGDRGQRYDGAPVSSRQHYVYHDDRVFPGPPHGSGYGQQGWTDSRGPRAPYTTADQQQQQTQTLHEQHRQQQQPPLDPSQRAMTERGTRWSGRFQAGGPAGGAGGRGPGGGVNSAGGGERRLARVSSGGGGGGSGGGSSSSGGVGRQPSVGRSGGGAAGSGGGGMRRVNSGGGGGGAIIGGSAMPRHHSNGRASGCWPAGSGGGGGGAANAAGGPRGAGRDRTTTALVVAPATAAAAAPGGGVTAVGSTRIRAPYTVPPVGPSEQAAAIVPAESEPDAPSNPNFITPSFPQPPRTRTDSCSAWALMVEAGSQALEAVVGPLLEGALMELFGEAWERELYILELPLPPFTARTCAELVTRCKQLHERLPITIHKRVEAVGKATAALAATPNSLEPEDVTASHTAMKGVLQDCVKAIKMPSLLGTGSRQFRAFTAELLPQAESTVLYYDMLLADCAEAAAGRQQVRAAAAAAASGSSGGTPSAAGALAATDGDGVASCTTAP